MRSIVWNQKKNNKWRRIWYETECRQSWKEEARMKRNMNIDKVTFEQHHLSLIYLNISYTCLKELFFKYSHVLLSDNGFYRCVCVVLLFRYDIASSHPFFLACLEFSSSSIFVVPWFAFASFHISSNQLVSTIWIWRGKQLLCLNSIVVVATFSSYTYNSYCMAFFLVFRLNSLSSTQHTFCRNYEH